jgi:pimeloyl-ACP methyl ester carboxylesterase
MKPGCARFWRNTGWSIENSKSLKMFMSETVAKIKLDEISLSYKEWSGDRGPVICLHSLIGHKGTFDQVASRLAPAYHLYALDLRGRGDSDKPDEGYGFSYHARDIIAFVDALGIDRFDIIGHSFGATAGVYLASIRPQRVRSLTLIDGGADPKEEVLEAMYAAIRRLGRAYDSPEAYLESMRSLPYFQEWNPGLEAYLLDHLETLDDGRVQAKSSATAIARDLDAHFYYSMCVHFPTLQCPTLFIRPQNGLLGDKAHVLDEREAAAFVAWIPNCWRVDLPGVNHFTMVLNDNPLVVPPIQAFLNRVAEETE